MARSLNKVQLIGNVGGQPDCRVTTGGKQVAAFTLATGESWTDKETGTAKEQVEWHRVVAFGKIAEVIAKYINKGSRLYVQGKQRTRIWEDKDGIKRYTTEVVVDMSGEIIFLDQKTAAESPAETARSTSPNPSTLVESEDTPSLHYDSFDDDIS